MAKIVGEMAGIPRPSDNVSCKVSPTPSSQPSRGQYQAGDAAETWPGQPRIESTASTELVGFSLLGSLPRYPANLSLIQITPRH